jgi:hypothetical protein
MLGLITRLGLYQSHDNEKEVNAAASFPLSIEHLDIEASFIWKKTAPVIYPCLCAFANFGFEKLRSRLAHSLTYSPSVRGIQYL